MTRLVFSSIGPDSRHPLWTQGAAPSFQLELVAYAPEGGAARWHRPGFKWPNFAWAAEQLPAYRSIAVLDDDLELDAEALNLAFDLFEEHGLWLAQPSLTADSAWSWPFTLQRPYLTLRYTHFVENGLTFLRGCDLATVLPACREAGSGFGLDWILPQLLGAPPQRIAVLDAVAARHPRRQSALDQVQSREQQAHQGYQLCQRFGYRPLPPGETGYLLNARGQRWAADCGSQQTVYAAATRYALHGARAGGNGRNWRELGAP